MGNLSDSWFFGIFVVDEGRFVHYFMGRLWSESLQVVDRWTVDGSGGKTREPPVGSVEPLSGAIRPTGSVNNCEFFW